MKAGMQSPDTKQAGISQSWDEFSRRLPEASAGDLKMIHWAFMAGAASVLDLLVERRAICLAHLPSTISLITEIEAQVSEVH